MLRQILSIGLGFCLVTTPVLALVEPEVKAWQEMVQDAEQACQVPGSEILVEALEELGGLAAALVDAPLHDLMVELEQRRDLEFKYFTPWHVKDRDTLRGWLEVQLKKEYPPEKVSKDEAILKALKLVPQDFELLPFLEDLLTSQIGGVYDPDKDQFFLVDTKSGRTWRDRAKDGLMARAGLSSGDQTEIIAIHELDHALGGQHFDFKTIMEDMKEWSTDRQMAAQALIEGDATFVMIDHQNKRPASEMGGQTYVAGAETMAKMIGTLAVLPIPIPGLGEFGSAPLYFRKGLMFPYFNGAELVTTLRHATLDWSAVNAAYGNLPHSTEQILHPENYLYVSTRPTIPDFSKLPDSIGEWEKVTDDTGGEFLLRIVLEQHGVSEYARAAEGWDGDRLRVYQHKVTQELGFVWVINWDTPSDAEEFRGLLGPAFPFRVSPGRQSVLLYSDPKLLTQSSYLTV